MCSLMANHLSLQGGENIQKTHLRLQDLIRKYSFIGEYTLLDNNFSTVFPIKKRITTWNHSLFRL